MSRIVLVVPCVAVIACGSAGPPRTADVSRLARGQTATIINGQPVIVDRGGDAGRPIALACHGFMLGGRRHACTDPTVESLALSPDHRTLAYTRVLDGLEGMEPWREIGVIGVDGSRQRTVIQAQPSALGGVSDVVWSDDAQRLWFVVDQTRLESVRIDGHDRRVLGAIGQQPTHDPPDPAGLASP